MQLLSTFNAIRDFCATKNVVPTSGKLMPVVREKMSFPWGEKALTRIVKIISFTWRKFSSKPHILTEKPETVCDTTGV
jgi:hypothetical protein